MNANPGDVPGRFQADVGPRVSAVDGFVDTVSGRDKLPWQPLTGPDVDHPGIRQRHVQTTHGGEFEEAIRHIPPVYSGIGGLPHAAMGGAEIVDKGVVGMSRHRNNAPTTVGTHESPLEGRKKAGVHATGVSRESSQGKEDNS